MHRSPLEEPYSRRHDQRRQRIRRGGKLPELDALATAEAELREALRRGYIPPDEPRDSLFRVMPIVRAPGDPSTRIAPIETVADIYTLAAVRGDTVERLLVIDLRKPLTEIARRRLKRYDHERGLEVLHDLANAIGDRSLPFVYPALMLDALSAETEDDVIAALCALTTHSHDDSLADAIGVIAPLWLLRDLIRLSQPKEHD